MKTYMQKLGKSLMLPVATLPLAALLLGIGYAIDPAGWGGDSAIAAFLVGAGGSILDNIGLVFAIGVAVGMAEDNDGSAALAGLIAMLTVNTLLQPASVANLTRIPLEEVNVAFNAINFKNVFMGMLSGAVAGELYNRFHRIQVPKAFAFFGGRRFVPIITGLVMLLVSLLLIFIWPVVYGILLSFGTWIAGMGAFGAGLYGFFNRLLIPTGLHHALNNVFWFDLVNINDIGKFWANEGVKGITGMYQGGFFPIFMFGLPAACFAMYQQADSKAKKVTASLLLAGAVTAFVTGVTEPIEFTFMFVAPQLYFVHALLTGVSLFIAATMQWTAGFAFSAGAIDFILSLGVPMANHPWMLIVQGLVFAVIYYVIFTLMIKKLDLNTPGRNVEATEMNETVLKTTGSSAYDERATAIFEALGGAENIISLTNCATRLRLRVNDMDKVDMDRIKATGVPGTHVLDDQNLHVIVGTDVEFVADRMRDYLKH